MKILKFTLLFLASILLINSNTKATNIQLIKTQKDITVDTTVYFWEDNYENGTFKIIRENNITKEIIFTAEKENSYKTENYYYNKCGNLTLVVTNTTDCAFAYNDNGEYLVCSVISNFTSSIFDNQITKKS